MPIRFTRRRLLEAAAVGTAQASGLAAEQNRSFADAGHVRGSVRPYEVVVADVDTTGLDPIEDRIVPHGRLAESRSRRFLRRRRTTQCAVPPREGRPRRSDLCRRLERAWHLRRRCTRTEKVFGSCAEYPQFHRRSAIDRPQRGIRPNVSFLRASAGRRRNRGRGAAEGARANSGRRRFRRVPRRQSADSRRRRGRWKSRRRRRPSRKVKTNAAGARRFILCAISLHFI